MGSHGLSQTVEDEYIKITLLVIILSPDIFCLFTDNDFEIHKDISK